MKSEEKFIKYLNNHFILIKRMDDIIIGGIKQTDGYYIYEINNLKLGLNEYNLMCILEERFGKLQDMGFIIRKWILGEKIYLNTKPVRIIETNPLIIRNKIL